MKLELNWTTVITAIVALIGGAISGGFTAYTQLSRAEEEFSIKRATMFKDLMVELKNEKTARMALLILWQLYPNERDQKIIVAAAIESGQPDLIDTIVGFDDELQQLSETLRVKAIKSGPDLDGSAISTLKKISPEKAANVMVEFLLEDIRLKGDRFIESENIFELIQMAREDEKVAEDISSRRKSIRKVPLMFDYLLYEIGEESAFIKRMKDGYVDRDNLQLMNGFLLDSDFNPEDAVEVFASAKKYIEDAINQNNRDEDYDLNGTLISLKSRSFYDLLKNEGKAEGDDSFATLLYETVTNPEKSTGARMNSLNLLRGISTRESLLAISEVLSNEQVSPGIREGIERQINEGIIELFVSENPGSKGPQHCNTDDLNLCLGQPQKWAEWRQKELSNDAGN